MTHDVLFYPRNLRKETFLDKFQLRTLLVCERTKRFSFAKHFPPPLPKKKKRERCFKANWLFISLHRSNKQQEKDKKFQRIQTEHIKSKLSSCFQLVHCISLVQQVYNYVTLLEHSSSTCAITGQINGSYFTVRPAKFKRLFELKAWVIMIFLLISFSRSVLQVMNLVFSTRYISFINYLELG